MHTNNRGWPHGRGGCHGGHRSGDDRPYHSSGHNNGGYNGGNNGGHHPRNTGNQHQRGGGGSRHPRDDLFIIDRGGERENNDQMNQYGNGGNYGGVRGNNDQMNQYGNGGNYGGVRGNNDQMNHYNGRGRDRSDREGEVNGTKRLASSSPDQRSDAVPTEVQSIMVESFESTNDDVTEEERANRKAFEDCLRDIDKALPVWKLAHQLPRDRWNETENKNETWNQREKNAVDATIKSIGEDLLSGRITRPWQSQYECGSDSSSDDSYPPGASRQKTPPRDLSPMEKRFIIALPHCLPLNRGFHLTEFGASEICYCPCGPNVEPWRTNNQISFDETDKCNQTKRFQPNDLMDHLRKEGGVYEEKEQGKKVKRDLNCMYHHATEVYLRNLYTDWHGKDFPHKALFPRLSKEYRRADDEDSRLRLRDLEFANREIKRHEEEKEKDRVELEKKNQEIEEFRLQAKDHLERLQELEKIRDKFDVEKRGKKDELSDSELAKYERMMIDYFDTMKQMHKPYKDGVTIEVTSNTDDESGFFLQDFFDNLYKKKEKAGASALLFGAKDPESILSPWEIVYDIKAELLAARGVKDKQARKELMAARKELMAKDEGGPSRQFLTDIFKQIDTLSVKVGSKSVALFENTPSGVWVTDDTKLIHDIELAAKNCCEMKKDAITQAKNYAIEQAKNYIKAIGRIMLHALANKQTLPTNAMPPFLIILMFHGYDNDYDPADILDHIEMLAFKGGETLKYVLECGETDGDGKPWTRETFFAKFIPDNFINTRKILLGSLQDGLTFGDHSSEIEKGCGLAIRWSMVPLQAIQHTYFARPDISVEELFANILQPKFGVGEPDEAYGPFTETDIERIKDEQEIFYNTGFKTFLTESAEEDPSFLVKLVECATGSNYLPCDQSFKINIEFDFSLDPLGYPLFHSCSHEIRFPGYKVYFSDYDKFKHDTKMIIDKIYNRFDMR